MSTGYVVAKPERVVFGAQATAMVGDLLHGGTAPVTAM